GRLTEYYPSGLVGGWLASKFVIYLGKIGGLIFLLLLTMVLFVITIQIEIVQIFRALGQQIHMLVNSIRERLDFIRETRAIKLAEKQRLQIEQERERIKQENLNKAEAPPKPDKKWKFPAFGKSREDIAPEIAVDKDIPEQNITSDKNKPGEPDLVPDKPEKHSDESPVQENKPVDKSGSGQNTYTQNEAQNLDFEVKEEHTDVEIDYDRLVKESMARYKFPSIDLLNDPPANVQSVTREELKANAEFLEVKLLDFGVKAKVVRVTAGPVITLYELQPAPGVKVSSIVNLANDLALALEARGIRIIAPIPGKAAVGIEIPNRHPQTVYLKSLLRSEQFSQAEYELPLALGKTINGESYIADLTKMPHLLVAGSTGSGKSVGINTMIMSMLYAVNPGKVKFIMIDPKKLELSL
ncbi:MAG: DNA translocase FtsK, partial [Calditrichaceae bacterium]